MFVIYLKQRVCFVWISHCVQRYTHSLTRISKYENNEECNISYLMCAITHFESVTKKFQSNFSLCKDMLEWNVSGFTQESFIIFENHKIVSYEMCSRKLFKENWTDLLVGYLISVWLTFKTCLLSQLYLPSLTHKSIRKIMNVLFQAIYQIENAMKWM